MNTGAAAKHSPRILCISPLFVPMADSEAFCGAKMVQALMRCGASVTVLSCRDFRDRPSDGSELWNSLNEVDVEVPLPRPPNRLHSIISATRFQTPFHARWVSAAVQKAKLLHRERDFDLIYTRSIPIAAHMVGYWCAKTLKLPWIANINDPWASEFFPLEEGPKLSAFWTAANIFWLRRTIRHADLVTYPCRRLKDFHSRIAKLDQAAEVMPHIGDKPKCPSNTHDTHFRLVHAGKLLAAEGRLGKAVLLGLKAFLDASADAATDTKLILVGPGDEATRSMISEMGLQRNVEFVGRVDYEESLDYIASSSVCVLIESRMDEGIFFPSKLADYLANGKPVLALSPRIGTAADLANRGELIRVDHDPDAVRDAIATLYSQYKCGTLTSRNPSDQLQAQLQEHTIAERFLSRCQALISTWSDGRAARLERIHQQGPLFEQFF
jgi:glycosyltransferase involved in cell wall biosynthesis